jgi:hypothetical protein
MTNKEISDAMDKIHTKLDEGFKENSKRLGQLDGRITKVETILKYLGYTLTGLVGLATFISMGINILSHFSK